MTYLIIFHLNFTSHYIYLIHKEYGNININYVVLILTYIKLSSKIKCKLLNIAYICLIYYIHFYEIDHLPLF